MNKPVKKIALVANAAKPTARRIVQRAAKLAAAAGMKPITDETKAHSADLVMVFGGDGTMLQWARNTAGSGTPIFGVNIGGMGFLTAVSGKDLAKAIRSIAAREFSVESRTLLSATGEADGGRFRLDAMNDFVISRGSVPRMIRLEVKVNGEVLTVYRCDGLVVSSATGSTAYSLAAGGAIVAPDAGVFSITPICPHTLSNRTVIVGQQSTVEVRVLDRQREATLSADGRDVVELAAGNPVMFDAAGNENVAGDRLMYDNLYAYGARSFSIRDADGALVWDSGDAFEQYIASAECMLGANRNIPCADYFNSTHDEGDVFDNRSDNKGPEPEGVTLGQLGEKTFAFIGLERMGGVMVWDITDPTAPEMVDYLNTRADWTTEDTESVLADAGDLGPEGLVFVSAEDSPNGEALLIVGHEVSGTTTVYQVNQVLP